MKAVERQCMPFSSSCIVISVFGTLSKESAQRGGDSVPVVNSDLQ